jgi:hypothetical protein
MAECHRFTRKVRLPGLPRELELRLWTISDLALHSGVSRPTASLAAGGGGVSMRSARKIREALELHPPSQTARDLHRAAIELSGAAWGGRMSDG